MAATNGSARPRSDESGFASSQRPWHDLDKTATEGHFRLDLLHRIRGGGAIVLPPLRARLPFDGIIDRLFTNRGRRPQLTRSARDALRLYPWPGNLRELVSVVDTTVAFARDGDSIRLEHLPIYLQRAYLSLPLELRAPGTICDVADDEGYELGLPAALVETRVDRLGGRFFVEAKVEESELAALYDLLDKLVDVADENAQARARLAKARNANALSQRHEHVRRTWAAILEHVPLPEEVAGG